MVSDQDIADRVARMMGEAFAARFRLPRYRYYGPARLTDGDRLYCWTVEPAYDERGRARYASWVWRVQGKRLVQTRRRLHKLRRDAKGRALTLYKGEDA
jgi:hypothetical protein